MHDVFRVSFHAQSSENGQGRKNSSRAGLYVFGTIHHAAFGRRSSILGGGEEQFAPGMQRSHAHCERFA
jgi:hypothetical protein